MKIAVINGSPKGDNSITLQTVKYLELLYPQHTFSYLNAAAKINALTRDFSPARQLLSQADAILFSYPVYTFLAPSQLHAFISLMKSDGTDLSGKYFTQITTSKHFYDVTAHRYVEENCADMGMKCVRGLSADMDDLPTKKGQKEAKAFFDYFLWSAGQGLYETDLSAVPAGRFVCPSLPDITAGENGQSTSLTVIVTDASPDDSRLNMMIERFRRVYPGQTKLIDLNAAGIKGGCLGCLRCVVSGKCVYKDGFDDFLRNEIQSADATVYAFTVRDHSMGVLFKTFDDRQFCNGHRTVTAGKPVAYLVSGAISAENNLLTVIKARASAGGNYLCGIASDESDPDGETDVVAKRLSYAVQNSYTQPSDFYGVGGMKIFRDLIYQMRGMMRADHKFYKKNGMYDFPHKKKATTAAMYLVGCVFANEKLLSKAAKYIEEGMLMPGKKVLDEVNNKKK